ncbi:TM2 domain-containing protein [Litoribacter populi]|uniref:TM2 domain-containing protein n=1 Tax=Litoribacter populi TaxID=2598460 RepID=UPI00118036E0|nr:TM2 domain-containing protein [Litoribacter populi]
MANVLRHLPELEGMELGYIQGILKNMNEEQAHMFAQVYRARRKDAQMVLILSLVGFVGFAGLHRFVLGQIGLGILYLLTAGLCFIGTIVDLVNYKSLAYEYNVKVAHETLSMMSHMNNPENPASNEPII